MSLKLCHQDGVAVIRMLVDMDMEEVVHLKNSIASLASEGCCQVVVDCSRVQHINATALGILAERLHFLRHRAGDLRLSGLNPQLQTLFELTGLRLQFRIFAHSEEAARSFHALTVAA